ncbi:MAG: hypothetical protein WA012_08810 [Rhodoferax sp.]|uniref:hypothetical protein n=1 Tax=Rhodoferax sp. TaxID=50421 RepID=UPI003BB0E43D
MKPELQSELFRRYPKLFRKPGKRLVDREVISVFDARLQDDNGPFDEHGIECGEGWFNLVDRLSGACESEIERLMAQGVPTEGWPRIAQIKEKMGGLRFYVNGPLSDDLRTQILKVENIESLHTCERCGSPGKLRDGRWQHTYCNTCDQTE